MTQDLEARDLPPVRLRRVLALLRILAGRRGTAAVSFWGLGFGYTIIVARSERTPLSISSDPDALGEPMVRVLLADALDIGP